MMESERSSLILGEGRTQDPQPQSSSGSGPEPRSNLDPDSRAVPEPRPSLTSSESERSNTGSSENENDSNNDGRPVADAENDNHPVLDTHDEKNIVLDTLECDKLVPVLPAPPQTNELPPRPGSVASYIQLFDKGKSINRPEYPPDDEDDIMDEDELMDDYHDEGNLEFDEEAAREARSQGLYNQGVSNATSITLLSGIIDLDLAALQASDEEKQSLLKIVDSLQDKVIELETNSKTTDKLARSARKKSNEAKTEVARLQPESDTHTSLAGDIFTLMTTERVFTKSWFFGLVTFFLQMALLILIFIYQLSQGNGSTPFDIPYTVSVEAHIAQFLAIFVSVGTSKDVVMPVKELSMLWITHRDEWRMVIDDDNADSIVWASRILLPNLLKFTEGVFVLLISFVIIIQSDNVIDLFKDFAAMQLIAELDNVAFWLANHGYFGSHLKKDTIRAKKVRVKDEVPKVFFDIPLRPFVLFLLFVFMIGGFIPIVVSQRNGRFFYEKYPSCSVRSEKITLAGNDRCDGGELNSVQCGFDGGDCLDFNLAYTECRDAREPWRVGDRTCDDEYNTPECLYDGGDCCPVKGEPFIGDGDCNGGFYNTKACNYDNGDCSEFKKEYPNCLDLMDFANKKDGTPIVLGDGICEFNAHYMNEECGFSFGDCKGCDVPNADKLGDGQCDGSVYNMLPGCSEDAGDCNICNSIVDDRSKIGDGVCNGGQYMLDGCNMDGGDCDDCIVSNIYKIGDGECNGGPYMASSCSNDGGDCDGCDVDDNSKVGDGHCDGGPYMSSSCSNDGGDCKGCNVDNNTKVGDDVCHGGLYNVAECGWDGGDCNACNSKLFALNLNYSLIGDGVCNGNEYMTQECGRDGGDCSECDVDVADISRIGDGQCDIEFNTPECGHDGLDCYVDGLPECFVQNKSLLGNGICNGGNYSLEACAFDDGDCTEFLTLYDSQCIVPEPTYVNNTICNEYSDGRKYNSAACGYDGGDCAARNANKAAAYPYCRFEAPVEIGWLGNGECHKQLNHPDCGYDDGDCDEYNQLYQNNDSGCDVNEPYLLFNGKCDLQYQYFTSECGYDGGECQEKIQELERDESLQTCPRDRLGFLLNNRCDSFTNTAQCLWDNEDCLQFNQKYPRCASVVGYPWKIGDGNCDSLPYNIDDCGYDGGDCVARNANKTAAYPDCNITSLGVGFLGDGDLCNSLFNTKECGYDDGDCTEINSLYPNCSVDKLYFIGDGTCHDTLPGHNTIECGWDGGDCFEYPKCNVADLSKVNDGTCDDALPGYNTIECGWDGGDCFEYPKCNVADLSKVNDGTCDDALPGYNTIECGFDGGDCL